jgi:DNA-binding NarL/FixJ family response regulator
MMSARHLTDRNRSADGDNTPTAAAARPETVRVMLADGDGLALQLVDNVLRTAPDLVLVSTAVDARQATRLARHHRPDVLLIESALPDTGGLEVVRDLAGQLPETRVVMLCAHGDDHEALRALRAGANGYLTKDLDPAALPGLVHQAARGEPVIPPALLPGLLQALRELPDTGWRPVRSRLTTRQWEIVGLLEDGASTADIAVALSISTSTVYSHLKSLTRTLHVHSRHDVTDAARRLRRQETLAAASRPARPAVNPKQPRHSRPPA